MNRLLLASLVSATLAPQLAYATETPEAQKLPVDLPSIVIRGEDETAGPLLPGNKLSPDEPGAMAFTLPRPKTALDLGSYLAQASESVLPTIAPASESLSPATLGYRELRLGASGLRRFDVGAYVGHVLDPGLLPFSLTTLADLDAQTADEWSNWELRLEAAASESVGGSLKLQHRSSLLSPGESVAQGAELSSRYQLGSYALTCDLESGRVAVPAAAAADSSTWRGALGGTYHPDLPWTEHSVELAGTLGARGTEKRLDPVVYLKASDRLEIVENWALHLSLGVGQVGSSFAADPELEVQYHPSENTELAAGVRSETILPTFSELYLSRRLIAGNGALVEQRAPWRFDLSGTQRLSDQWYAHAAASYLAADRVIAWRQLPSYPSLWQPYNPGMAGDSGSMTQGITQAQLDAQYQAWDEGSQRFYYRWRTVQPLGEVAQEAGTVHQSTWLHGKLLLDIGGSVALQQLGLGQISQMSATGWIAMLEGGVTYRVNEHVAVYARVDAWPLQVQQPVSNFFAPDSLAVVGVSVGF